ncbi:sensor histidine kinase [Cryptosporangium phraense]|uniref:sensor histidine kinase n=1 Tax=Cryptosporangium phraense TaxID=2593070 RepID=UPI0014794838|nr:sensor histidine kinase [Cryptosporangium phraense]
MTTISSVRRLVRSPRLDVAVLHAADVVAAVVFVGIYVLFVGIAGGPASDTQQHYAGPAGAGWVIAVAVGAPIAVRRRWPFEAWAVSCAGLTVATSVHLTLEPWIPVAIILFSVALKASWPRALVAIGVTLAACAGSLTVAAVTDPNGRVADTIGLVAYVSLISGGSWVAGAIVRERRAAAEERRQRDAERALADERLQIARELHDVVAHSMSLIAVQAGVANHVVEEQPEAARDAMRVIENTSRSALTDIRRMLGVLRTPEAELAPAPGLDAIPALVERARASGVRVAFDGAGAGRYSEALQLVVYRVVQEALTNAVKHAAPTACRLRLEAADGVLRIEVEDDGPPSAHPDPPEGGHGLIGLRERVALYGGTLVAGPRPEGGFRLVATLPTDGSG